MGNNQIHLPDLLFVKYCESEFGINRGIYNTIDDYFFHLGIINIYNRREIILRFLTYFKVHDGIKSNGRVKVGNKGLKYRLEEFCVENTIKENIV